MMGTQEVRMRASGWVLSLGLTVGCAAQEESKDTGSAGTTVQLTDTGPAPEFVDHLQVQPILNDNCGPCHLDGNISGGLVLGNVLSLIAKTSLQSGLRLIEPGDSSRSYLIFKLRGDPFGGGGYGRAMPRDSPPLTERQIQTIEVWIDEGCTVVN